MKLGLVWFNFLPLQKGVWILSISKGNADQHFFAQLNDMWYK